MIEFAFWILAALVLYVYAGYPLLLYLVSRTQPKPNYDWPDELPSVTLLISAFNEEDCIAEKLENSLNLDYPSTLLEISGFVDPRLKVEIEAVAYLGP